MTRPRASSDAEFLADAFLLLIVDDRELDGTTAPRKGKKLYAVEGSAQPSLPAVVENLVAMALFRACESDLVESFRLPQTLCVWRSSRDREVDFLAGLRPHQVPVEVKYQNQVGAQDTLTIRNALGRGIVFSRHDVELSGPVIVAPVAAFRATLQHSGAKSNTPGKDRQSDDRGALLPPPREPRSRDHRAAQRRRSSEGSWAGGRVSNGPRFISRMAPAR